MEQYTITSEDSSIHWKYFDFENKRVLDLGCGRWHTKDYDELGPVYFSKKALIVVGVDCSIDEINFYKSNMVNNTKSIFLHECINNPDQIKKLLSDHQITALKCDIEGAEEVLLHLNKEDLSLVDELAIEYHNYELKEAFISKIQDWGFTVKTHANFFQTPDFMGVYFCSKLK
jgi:hypothetical protein